MFTSLRQTPSGGRFAALQERLSSILFDLNDTADIWEQEREHLGRQSGGQLYGALTALEKVRGGFARTSERALGFASAWQAVVRAQHALAEPLSQGDLIPLAYRPGSEDGVVAQLQTAGACTSTAEATDRMASRMRARVQTLRHEMDTAVVRDMLAPRKAQYRRAREEYLKRRSEEAKEAWKMASLNLQAEAVAAVQRYAAALDEIIRLLAENSLRIGQIMCEEWRDPNMAIREVGTEANGTERAEQGAGGAGGVSAETERAPPTTTEDDAPAEEGGGRGEFALYDELDAEFDNFVSLEDATTTGTAAADDSPVQHPESGDGDQSGGARATAAAAEATKIDWEV